MAEGSLDEASKTVGVYVDMEVSVLNVGVKFSYQIPSFSVITVDLRQMKFQLAAEDGSVRLFDGFIRAEPSIVPEKVPFAAEFCFVTVRFLTFQCCIDNRYV